jgi:NAD(P)-dependent dehydrogenase (short-subunit alcohol dehydrogenase family)/L-rhamnose mutarotase
MDLQLKGKVILVTGGSKGIGQAIVRTLAEEGAIPVIVDRDVKAGPQLRDELKSNGQESFLISTEVSTPESCQVAISQTVAEYGRIDGLVNNAGVNDRVGLEHGSPEQFQISLQRNLLHYYHMAHYALGHLKQSRGAMVNISSKTALTGQGGTSGYASAKGAILALTREWAAELLPYGIRVNAVIPAEVMTPLYRKWINSFEHPEEKLRAITAQIPLGKRMTTAEEIAAMTVFLLSAKSGHTTGQHLVVDGGYVHLDRALTQVGAQKRRYYLTLDLKDDPKLIAEYKRYHEKVWPEITQSLKDSGVEALEIYLQGNRMFMVIEANERFSPEAQAKVMRENPKVREWEDLMWRFQQPLPQAQPGEKWLPMERIFKLES